MPVPQQYNTFSQTGWPAQCKIKYGSAGAEIASPGPGKAIHVIGVISWQDLKIRRGTASNPGSTIFTMQGAEPGAIRLPGAVSMGEDQGLLADTGDDVTIFYYIHDENLETGSV